MAHTADSKHQTPPTDADVERQQHKNIVEDQKYNLNYSQRAQWLRAALLGANDGLVSTASLIMGVGAVRDDIKAMVLTGFAGLVAGACSMAIGEFISVYSQVDIEVAQMKRREAQKKREILGEEGLGRKEESSDSETDERVQQQLPSPMQAAMASGLSFSVGAAVPLLAAMFVRNYKVRLGVVAVAASMALLVFGATGAVLGRAPLVRSSLRVLLGGWLAMAITFGLTKLIGSAGL